MRDVGQCKHVVSNRFLLGFNVPPILFVLFLFKESFFFFFFTVHFSLPFLLSAHHFDENLVPLSGKVSSNASVLQLQPFHEQTFIATFSLSPSLSSALVSFSQTEVPPRTLEGWARSEGREGDGEVPEKDSTACP